MPTLNPSAATPLLLLMGVVASVAVHQLFLWFGRRRETLHPWVVTWCATSLVVLAGHHLQAVAETPAGAGLGARLAWISSLSLITVMIGLSHALARRAVPRPLLAGLVGANLALLALAGLGEGVVTNTVYLRTDGLGLRYWALEPGPLMTALVPCLLAVFAYCVVTVWRSRALAIGERRAVLGGFAVYLVFAINDVLHAARVIQSVRLFDYAFVAVAVGLHYLLVARFNRVSADLEGAVADQTRTLETRQEALAALLRAERAVMTEVDLKSMLAVIVTEASRIAGTPYVKVLLLDRERRVLRIAAVAGGVVPVGTELPLGSSYSGTVATTGEVLFSPDTQNDPKNFLAAQDRAAGVVNYLGLPIKAKGRVLGVLTLNTEKPRDFGEEEIADLTSFADLAALALEHARLREDLEDRLSHGHPRRAEPGHHELAGSRPDPRPDRARGNSPHERGSRDRLHGERRAPGARGASDLAVRAVARLSGSGDGPRRGGGRRGPPQPAHHPRAGSGRGSPDARRRLVPRARPPERDRGADPARRYRDRRSRHRAQD
jgi:putative methionine-R-sulfoxide reductase with GAF domain